MGKSAKFLFFALVFVVLFSVFVFSAECSQKFDSVLQVGSGSISGANADNDPTLSRNNAKEIKDAMTAVLYEEPGALDPQASSMTGNAQVCAQIFDTLLYKDQTTGELLPCLATSWEQIDDLTYRFNLRNDVYWHNGEKFVVDDVVYTIKRLATASATKSRYSSLDIEHTAAIDEKTVELKLKEPWAKVLLYFSTALSSIVNEKVMEDSKGNPKRNPIGTGPYKFVSWTTGDSIVLERNENYWDDVAFTKNIVFKFIPDSSIRAIQLEAEDVDFFIQVGAQDYNRLIENPKIYVSAGSGYTHESMYFSQKCKSVYQNVLVRKAMTYALDMPSVVKAVWGPLAVAASSIYSSALEGYLPVGPVKQDIGYAKQLLAEAGYPNGIDCEINFPNNTNTSAYMEICQAMWAEAGIRVTLNSFDSATVKQMNTQGTNPMGRSNFTASTGDPVHALAAWEIGYSGVMQPKDQHIDDLIKRCRAEADGAKRAGYLEEIQRYALEEKYYAIPVAFINVSYAMSDNVFGFEFSPGELISFRKMGVYVD